MSKKLFAISEPQWEFEAMMPKGLYGHGSAIIDDKLYIIGGRTFTETFFKEVYIYDLKLKTWNTGKSMPNSVNVVISAAVEDKIYVFGVYAGKASTQIYDTVTNSWRTGAPMPTYRNSYNVAAAGSKIYVMGGFVEQDFMDVVEIYDTETNIWSPGANMPFPKANFGIASLNNTIYVISGQLVYGASTDNYSDTIDVYHVETDTWGESLTDQKRVRNVTTALVGNSIIASGGLLQPLGVSVYPDDADIYDTVNNQWKSMTPLPMGLFLHTAHIYNGNMYIVGGGYDTGNETVGSNNVIFKLSINNRNLSIHLEENETARLVVTGQLTDNTDYNWSSSDASIAEVDVNGYVTAVTEGECSVTAESKDGAYSDDISVKVALKGEAERLAAFLDPGETKDFYLNEDKNNIQWQSMDSTIATVNRLGKVTGVSTGLAIVQAEYDGELYHIYVRVG